MAEYIFEMSDALYDEATGQMCMKPEYKGKLTRCKDCTKWDRHDGTFKDVDGKEWHNCKTLCFRTMAYFYCADAEREAE